MSSLALCLSPLLASWPWDRVELEAAPAPAPPAACPWYALVGAAFAAALAVDLLRRALLPRHTFKGKH